MIGLKGKRGEKRREREGGRGGGKRKKEKRNGKILLISKVNKLKSYVTK